MGIRCKTLSDHFISKSTLEKDIFLIFIGAVFIGLFAKLSMYIPGNPVPITFSCQAALFVGAALGWRKGTMALLTYLGMGIMGLPVFSVGATQGFARLISPTGGYLIGYVIAAGLMGYFAEKAWDRSLLKSVIAVSLGHAIILFLGWVWLSYYLGNPVEAFNKGVLPFIVLDFTKALFLSMFLPATWRMVKKI